MAEKELNRSGAGGDVRPTPGKAEGSREDVEATIRREAKKGFYKNVAGKIRMRAADWKTVPRIAAM